MTRDEALTLISKYENTKNNEHFDMYDKGQYFAAKGVLEGYELGVRDSAKVATTLDNQDLISSKRVVKEILALLEVKEKKA